jgi:hypothetical protein
MNIKRTGSTTWKEWMKEDLMKDFTSTCEKVGEAEVDYTSDGKASSEMNLVAGLGS